VTRAFIGIGSNIAPEENIREALRRLAQSVRLVSISTFYREPAMDRREEPPYYNGVVAIDTDLPPATLKWEVLRPIEAVLGRRRSSDKYAPRTIDLDLLLYDDYVLSNDDLKLPDPDILKRAFIAIPLCELAPALVLPGSGVPIRQAAGQLATESMESLPEYTQQLRSELLGGQKPL
jgi:dihydroneopterin aldolase/2-amino-4-hydroxy-6-hydroxymethyldihydropteridine diphosphokinase